MTAASYRRDKLTVNLSNVLAKRGWTYIITPMYSVWRRPT